MNKKWKTILCILPLALVFSLLLTFLCCGCSSGKVDYPNVEDFEAALNAGEDLTGKTVTFTVLEVHPSSAFGYNLYAGEHLNFVSSKNPGVKEGDTITVKVEEVNSILGSWIISYKKVK